jgi:long-chain acyl-CoA synthetase
MAELLLSAAQTRTAEPALTDETGTTTWGALNPRVNRLIHALRGLGLGVGDAIAIHSRNRREYFELMIAASHSGLRYVLVNWHWTADELNYVLADSRSSVLFSEDSLADVARGAVEGLALKGLVSLGGPIEGFTPYEEFLAADDSEPADQSLGVPMMYTSGTTGRPKGVSRSMLKAGAPVATIDLIGQVFAELLLIPEGGTTLLVGPVYHSAQWLWSFGLVMVGRRVVMRQGWDPAETLRLIDEYHVTNVHLVPTQFVRLLRLPSSVREEFDGSSLAAVWHGAAPCSPEVKRQMIDWWGPIVHEYYGSTEASVNTIVTAEEWLKKPGTVGRPLPATEVRILRPDGSAADPGERGQIWFRYTSGDDIEYWGDKAKTESIHKAGLFTTGDIGYFDEDGYLFLADRAIDMIISGGVNIYPAEIEGVLITHPAVRDVAVFGIPDEEYGEQVKAAVELSDGFEPSDELAERLVEHTRARLAGYKAPRTIDFVAEMPRTPTGKLYKRLLRDPYWAEQGKKI